MTTVAFTQFLPEVLPSVQGCSDILALNAIRNAAIEFCGSTMYWQETQDPVTLTAADLPYDFEAPTGANVIQPLSIRCNGSNVVPKSLDWLDANIPNWATLVADYPSFYYQPNPNQMVLVGQPSTSVDLTIRVAYIPARTATGVDQTLYQYYLEAIAFGALTRLCAVPGQPWTNPEVAQYSRAMFNNAMTDATIEANKSYDRGGLKVQHRKS